MSRYEYFKAWLGGKWTTSIARAACADYIRRKAETDD